MSEGYENWHQEKLLNFDSIFHSATFLEDYIQGYDVRLQDCIDWQSDTVQDKYYDVTAVR